jgi:hypothetical protein
MTAPTPAEHDEPTPTPDPEAGFDGLRAALGSMGRPSCPRDLSGSILARIAAEPVPWWLSRPSRRRWLPLGAAAAAAAALLVTVWPTPPPTPHRAPVAVAMVPAVAAPAPAPASPAPTTTPAAPVVAAAAPSRSAERGEAALMLPGLLGPFATAATFEIARNAGDEAPAALRAIEDAVREVAPAHPLRGTLHAGRDGSAAVLLMLDATERASLARVLDRRFPGRVVEAVPTSISAVLDEARSGELALRSEPSRPSAPLRPLDGSHLALRDAAGDVPAAAPAASDLPDRPDDPPRAPVHAAASAEVDRPRPCLIRLVQRAR